MTKWFLKLTFYKYSKYYISFHSTWKILNATQILCKHTANCIFLTKLIPCKELNRKPNLFLFKDRNVLVLKAEDDTVCCHMGKFFLDNSLRDVMQRSSGLEIHDHL